MPAFYVHGKARRYATEEELLAFANKLRAAGAADPLDALLPGKRGKGEACLIANACNFGCEVSPCGGWWGMFFPHNVSRERIDALATAVDCEVLENFSLHPELATHYIRLPEKIGNTAHAFDLLFGWTAKYAIEDE